MPKTNFRIAMDLDGVLADTIRSFCNILNTRRSTAYSPEVFDRWNAWEIAHISREEFLRTLDEAWFNWKSIPSMEEDIAMKVSRLTQFGRVDIVTGRSEATVPYAEEWLRFHRIPFANLVRTESTSAKAELDYDIFIDDSEFLMSLIASRLFGFGFLYTQPWNISAKILPRIFRIRRWEDVPPLIAQLQ